MAKANEKQDRRQKKDLDFEEKKSFFRKVLDAILFVPMFALNAIVHLITRVFKGKEAAQKLQEDQNRYAERKTATAAMNERAQVLQHQIDDYCQMMGKRGIEVAFKDAKITGIREISGSNKNQKLAYQVELNGVDGALYVLTFDDDLNITSGGLPYDVKYWFEQALHCHEVNGLGEDTKHAPPKSPRDDRGGEEPGDHDNEPAPPDPTKDDRGGEEPKPHEVVFDNMVFGMEDAIDKARGCFEHYDMQSHWCVDKAASLAGRLDAVANSIISVIKAEGLVLNTDLTRLSNDELFDLVENCTEQSQSDFVTAYTDMRMRRDFVLENIQKIKDIPVLNESTVLHWDDLLHQAELIREAEKDSSNTTYSIDFDDPASIHEWTVKLLDVASSEFGDSVKTATREELQALCDSEQAKSALPFSAALSALICAVKMDAVGDIVRENLVRKETAEHSMDDDLEASICADLFGASDNKKIDEVQEQTEQTLLVPENTEKLQFSREPVGDKMYLAIDPIGDCTIREACEELQRLYNDGVNVPEEKQHFGSEQEKYAAGVFAAVNASDGYVEDLSTHLRDTSTEKQSHLVVFGCPPVVVCVKDKELYTYELQGNDRHVLMPHPIRKSTTKTLEHYLQENPRDPIPVDRDHAKHIETMDVSNPEIE